MLSLQPFLSSHLSVVLLSGRECLQLVCSEASSGWLESGDAVTFKIICEKCLRKERAAEMKILQFYLSIHIRGNGYLRRHIRIIPEKNACSSQELNVDKTMLRLLFLKFLRSLLSSFSSFKRNWKIPS